MDIRTNAKYDSKETPLEVKNREMAYKAAAEGIVLLQNNGVLPLEPCKAALYGIGAAINIKGGTGSGEVNERHSISIREGMESAGFTITTGQWISDYMKVFEEGKRAHGGELLQKMMSQNPDDMINIMANPYCYPFGRQITEVDMEDSDTDLGIYIISRQAGECADRSLENYDYEFSDVEVENIRRMSENYRRFVLVINVGGSMDLSRITEIKGIGAILYYCQQGQEGGRAFADILTGKISPSGCLSDTWVNSYYDIPFGAEYSYLSGDSMQENYKEGIYVGYRYFDSFMKEVRYEFGYGLSYTTFDINFCEIRHSRSQITVKASVTNTGDVYAGKKVVQLYMSSPAGKIAKEYQSLAAFAKTDVLKPGETQILELQFNMADFSSYDTELSCYVLEKGYYMLRLGESSRNTRVCARINIEEDICTEQCRELRIKKNNITELSPYEYVQAEELMKVSEVILSDSDFEQIVHKYNLRKAENESAKELLSRLDLKEKIKLVTGTGVMGAKPYFSVPGAAAFSADFPEKGIANMSFCDGPAGLRLQKVSVADENGNILPTEPMMEFMNYLPEEILKSMLGDTNKGTPIYQYATAFPVGTALAQTWNTALLKEVGNAVGKEMREYGATFWLAPGLNIHRNPLCGRNYEYFSEDPYLSGVCAAAITSGVQENEGCCVTLKHFVANNQETNRNHVSSNMDERTLREIYLKGFRLAVQKGNAKGVMTSYNLLNGRYTSTSRELCTTILREEWGFDGLVMTDWFGTGEGLADNAKTLKAGVDLIMPGGEEYQQKIAASLEIGELSEDDLDTACIRILAALIHSQTQKRYMNKE